MPATPTNRTTRPLRPADAAAALAIIHEAFSNQPLPTDPPSAALNETAATIGAAIAADGGAGIEVAGRLIAVLLWRQEPGRLYFGRLAVLPAWHGQGVGRALVAAAEAEARRRGLPRTRCSTRLSLVSNRTFFAVCGYREAGLETHPGYTAPTSITLEKEL